VVTTVGAFVLYGVKCRDMTAQGPEGSDRSQDGAGAGALEGSERKAPFQSSNL
jgi:hypothetical protein